MKYDAIIIGGGAAGLFCAFQAGKRGRRVLVIEHNQEVGRKIIISGGGRCNFTNVDTQAENFVSRNPHFAKSALSRYTASDFVELVRKHRIHYYEKTLGQLFCRQSSRQIVEMLLRECSDAGAEIVTRCRTNSITKDTEFRVETSRGVFEAGKLVIACGGLSFPKVGATDLGYQIARQYGLEIVDTRPSLVALVLEGASYKQLAGVAVDARVTYEDHSFRENILFTHRGLSGPAILQISNYWQKGRPVSIDLLPDADAVDMLLNDAGGRKEVGNYLSQFLPQRLARELAQTRFPNKPIAQLTRKEIETMGTGLNNWQVRFRDTEGYDRAEVTLGGVATTELSSKTMESKRVKGLFFIGEVVDVTGWLGGYNFQWAWSSGFAAGNAI
ncbi:MAG: NAD(P)/FAD-dependent oxidoreductase [Pyrinomonadaceae bacterium]